MVEENLSITLEPGIVIYYRAPTAKEIADCKDSIQLADAIMVDVENLNYWSKSGKVKKLGKHIKPKHIKHYRVLGVSPKIWKNLIPDALKEQFIKAISH